MSPENRNSGRSRTFLRGEIVFASGASRIECVVREISDLGVRIEAPTSVSIPEIFDLIIPQRNTNQKVRMIWRRQSEIGAAFVDKNERGASDVKAQYFVNANPAVDAPFTDNSNNSFYPTHNTAAGKFHNPSEYVNTQNVQTPSRQMPHQQVAIDQYNGQQSTLPHTANLISPMQDAPSFDSSVSELRKIIIDLESEVSMIRGQMLELRSIIDVIVREKKNQ